MDDKEFKKHIKDLAHGHHHPEEHDWTDDTLKIADEPANSNQKQTAKRKPPKRARLHG